MTGCSAARIGAARIGGSFRVRDAWSRGGAGAPAVAEWAAAGLLLFVTTRCVEFGKGLCAFVVAGRGDRAGVGDGSIVIGRERAYLALATKPTGWRGRRNPQHGEIEALDKEPQGYPDTETPRKIRSNALRRRRSESLRIASPSDAPAPPRADRFARPAAAAAAIPPPAARYALLHGARLFHAGGGRAAALGRTPTARSLLHSSRNS